MKILVVDDDMVIRMVLNKFFSKEGHHVVIAFDGQDATEHFHLDPNSFDIIVTDIMMPRMNGIDLALNIKNICPELPIIAITAGNIDHLESYDSLFQASFNKPLELSELYKEVLTLTEML